MFFICRVFTTHYAKILTINGNTTTKNYKLLVTIVVQFDYFVLRLQTIFLQFFHWKKTQKLYKANSGIYETSSHISVAGNIKHFEHFWDQKLKKASIFSMEILRNGYRLPFENIPPPFCTQNNKSSLKEKRFVEESNIHKRKVQIQKLKKRQRTLRKRRLPYNIWSPKWISSLPIHKDFQTFLGFSRTFQGVINFLFVLSKFCHSD